jgi:hypothetical protein
MRAGLLRSTVVKNECGKPIRLRLPAIVSVGAMFSVEGEAKMVKRALRVVGVIASALSMGCTLVPANPERISLRPTSASKHFSRMLEVNGTSETMEIPGFEAAQAVLINPIQLQGRECRKKRKHPFVKFIKQIENTLDDPIDDMKHKFHGMSMFGYRIYLPAILMKGGNPACR